MKIETPEEFLDGFNVCMTKGPCGLCAARVRARDKAVALEALGRVRSALATVDSDYQRELALLKIQAEYEGK